MADQLTTVSKQRLVKQAGALTHDDLRKVEHAMRCSLGWWRRRRQAHTGRGGRL
ncbi:MAG: type II toxin-antitoxin system PemK/MazF family toxin [Chloroflexi bacterium]|nr:type II toxin-antitoxin system PemK/MazF family toxin [Chloroflexota bacterium]